MRSSWKGVDRMVEAAVALSMLTGFCVTWLTGLYTGGMISAGYLALYADQPLRIVVTLGAAVLTAILLRLLSRRVILFGRRRYVAAMLMGFLLGTLLNSILVKAAACQLDARMIGHIVPGFIANDMMQQGLLSTLLSVVLSAAVVYLLLQAAVALGVPL